MKGVRGARESHLAAYHFSMFFGKLFSMHSVAVTWHLPGTSRVSFSLEPRNAYQQPFSLEGQRNPVHLYVSLFNEAIMCAKNILRETSYLKFPTILALVVFPLPSSFRLLIYEAANYDPSRLNNCAVRDALDEWVWQGNAEHFSLCLLHVLF